LKSLHGVGTLEQDRSIADAQLAWVQVQGRQESPQEPLGKVGKMDTLGMVGSLGQIFWPKLLQPVQLAKMELQLVYQDLCPHGRVAVTMTYVFAATESFSCHIQ
jgi:hypothetical protein